MYLNTKRKLLESLRVVKTASIKSNEICMITAKGLFAD